MLIPPILAQLPTPDPQPFIDTYGPVLGLILITVLFVLGGGLVMLYGKLNSSTAAQNAITKAFSDQVSELVKLRAEVTTLRAAVDAAEDRDALHTAELKSAIAGQKASTAKAETLEREVAELRAKVTQLETERTVRADELRRETERSARLETELKTAKGEITDLRARMARLEGENSALQRVIDKLNVVSVKPPPDDPNPPPPVALKVETVDKQERAA